MVMEEDGTRRTISKSFNFGPTDVIKLIRGVYSMLTSALILSWCVNWSQTNNFFMKLWTNVSRCFTIRFLRGGQLYEVEALGNLPRDVWGNIGKRLPSHLDILCFRSVCNNWRSSLPSPTRFPLLVSPPPNCDLELLNTSFIITEVDMYTISKCNKLYVAFEEVDKGGKLFRPNFLLPCRVINYPKESTMVSPPKPFNQLSFITKAFHLRIALPRSTDENNLGHWDVTKNKFVKKMVLINSSNPNDGVNPIYARAYDLIAVAHLSFGILEGRLALLRLGGGGGGVWDTDFCSQVFIDIGTYKEKLCTLDAWGRVFIMDNHSLQMTQLGPPLSMDWVPLWGCVVETCGGLYVVDTSPPLFRDIMVAYKLSLRHQKWRKVKGFIRDQLAVLKPFSV